MGVTPAKSQLEDIMQIVNRTILRSDSFCPTRVPTQTWK
jgi:hypothetical protein